MRNAKPQSIESRRHKPDYGLVLVSSILLIIGLIVIYSIGPALAASSGITVGKQFVVIAIGILAFAFAATISLDFWQHINRWLIYGAIGTSLALFVLPTTAITPDINGAKRWLVFGPISFQPAELIKFALLFYLAAFLAKAVRTKTINDIHGTLIPLGTIVGVLGVIIVILQRDLGTMMAVIGMTLAMLFVAGVRMKYFAGFAGAIAVTGMASILLVPHRMARFLTFLNPESDLQGAGYHLNQALIAIGSGGLFGLGLGKSVQAYGYLPEAANDSIFAIFAEKFGFFGVMVLLALFAALLIRIIHIIEHAPNTYTQLIATGIFAWILSHIVINIGAMLSLLPLTGITLPFISYGGSSLLFMMLSLGILFNISRYTTIDRFSVQEGGGKYENSTQRRRVRRSRYAA